MSVTTQLNDLRLQACCASLPYKRTWGREVFTTSVMAAGSVSLLLVLTSLTLVFALNYTKCPKQEIDGCYCMEYTYLFRGAYVSCSQINDNEVLQAKVAGLKGNPVDALQLDNVSLPYLPRSGLFEGTNIGYLWLSYSSLKYIASPDLKGPSPFVGLEDSVTEMKIEGMKDLINVDWSDFSILKKLTKITMYNLKLDEIDQSFSKLPPSFTYFDLLDGEVTKIAPGAFDLEGLVAVSLQGNRIERLDRNIFGTNTNLTSIRFSQNQLTEVSDDFLDNFPAVNFIDLGRNKLTRLPSSLRTNWPQFQNMYLAGNPLTCDCDLVWFLRLAKNQPPKYGDLEFIKCGGPSKLAGRKLLTLDKTDLCP